MTIQYRNIGHDQEVDDARQALKHILTSIESVTDLKAGEAALDDVSAVLRLPLAAWVPDTSNPYYCPELDSFALARGWPEELLKLWWDRNAALKMPLYIRCRFEHVPFLSTLDQRRHDYPTHASADQWRISEMMKSIGVTSCLTVPLHLPKGQIAMVTWAGDRNPDELKRLLSGIAGDLLGIGHYFMRIAQRTVKCSCSDNDERSRLTPREWDCLRTLAQGYREAEVAQLNGISKVTVRFHLDNVVQKFGCKTRTQAVALAAQLGLLGPIGC
jgi:DNA-binding CsgD family transcriptional regulator